jgi:hypothetical protein
MATDGFAVILVQGLGRRTDDEMKSGGVCQIWLSSALNKLTVATESDSTWEQGSNAHLLTLGICHRTTRGIVRRLTKSGESGRLGKKIR